METKTYKNNHFNWHYHTDEEREGIYSEIFINKWLCCCAFVVIVVVEQYNIMSSSRVNSYLSGMCSGDNQIPKRVMLFNP